MEQQLFQKKTESFTLEDVPSPKQDLTGINLKLQRPPSHGITRKYTSDRGEGDVSRKKGLPFAFCCCDNYSKRNNLGKRAPLGTKCIVVGKSQHWALETTGHVASTAKKQRAMNADTFSTFPCTADPKPADGSTHSGQV